MLEKICIIIIFILLSYQSYCDIFNIHSNNKEETNNKNKTPTENKKDDLEKEEKKQIEKFDNMYNNSLSEFEDFSYGKPHTIKSNENGQYYYWEFNDPLPWSKIVYNPNSNYNYNYYIILEIKSNKLFNVWKKIIPNLKYNNNELIIPSNDEEGALTLANLIINNLQNNLEMKDIINNNMIQKSIYKAKKYKIIKNKLKNQICELLYGFKNDNSRKEYTNDLAFHNIKDVARNKINMPTKRNENNFLVEEINNGNINNRNEFEKTTGMVGMETVNRELDTFNKQKENFTNNYNNISKKNQLSNRNNMGFMILDNNSSEYSFI